MAELMRHLGPKANGNYCWCSLDQKFPEQCGVFWINMNKATAAALTAAVEEKLIYIEPVKTYFTGMPLIYLVDGGLLKLDSLLLLVRKTITNWRHNTISSIKNCK